MWNGVIRLLLDNMIKREVPLNTHIIKINCNYMWMYANMLLQFAISQLFLTNVVCLLMAGTVFHGLRTGVLSVVNYNMCSGEMTICMELICMYYKKYIYNLNLDIIISIIEIHQ